MVIAALVKGEWVHAGSTAIVTITAGPKGTTEEAATQAIAIATTIVEEVTMFSLTLFH
ncbi:hypothetical protein Sjap_022302 [Stephania japonica]|uniref:Uncharacterized protein n=1 Tax=Stephania japonica TaxID=461633 RepID=A0AAP0ENN7_9MAGN